MPQDRGNPRRRGDVEGDKKWTEPGVPEAQITAKVNEFLCDSGSDFVYEVVCASDGNTTPYRRWRMDKPFHQGDNEVFDALQAGDVVGRVVVAVGGVS